MKRIIVLIALMLAGAGSVFAQSNPTDRIQRPCGSGLVKRAIVITNADGSVDIISCTGDPVRINGTVFPSGGAIGGLGTTNTFAIFTAATTIGNGLLTQTTAPNILNLVSGSFAYGGIAAPSVSAAGRGKFYFDSTSNTLKGSYNAAAYFDVARSNYTIGTLPLGGAGGLLGNSYASQSGNDFTLTTPATGVASFITPGGGLVLRGGTASEIDLTGSLLTLGDTLGGGNAGKIELNDVAQTMLFTLASRQFLDLNGSTLNSIIGKSDSAALGKFDATNAAVTLGDTNGAGNNTRVEIADGAQTITLRASGTAQVDVNGAGSVTLGDTLGSGNSTTLTVSDSGQNYIFSKLISCLALTTDGSGIVGCTVSDASLKENRLPFRRGLAAISVLRPESYSFKPGRYYNGGAARAGFIAQNVQAAIPEAVSKTGDGVLQVDQVTVLATAINAINELRARVESLEAENRRLRQRARR